MQAPSYHVMEGIVNSSIKGLLCFVRQKYRDPDSAGLCNKILHLAIGAYFTQNSSYTRR